MKNLIILGFALILSESTVCRGADVSFYPVYNTKFKQLKVPAKMTTESEESLKKSAYVYIGDLSYYTSFILNHWTGYWLRLTTAIHRFADDLHSISFSIQYLLFRDIPFI